MKVDIAPARDEHIGGVDVDGGCIKRALLILKIDDSASDFRMRSAFDEEHAQSPEHINAGQLRHRFINLAMRYHDTQSAVGGRGKLVNRRAHSVSLQATQEGPLKRRLLHGGGLELRLVDVVDQDFYIRHGDVSAGIDLDLAGKPPLIKDEV